MSNNESIKKTLLLDEDTIKILKDYSFTTSGSENISSAVRAMAREHQKRELDKKLKSTTF